MANQVAFCKRLKRAKISYYRDEARREDEVSIQAGIENGLANSKVLLAWYDPTYLDSRACAWEFSRAILAAKHQGGSDAHAFRRICCVDPTNQFSHIVPEGLWDRAHGLALDGPKKCISQLRNQLSEIDSSFGEISTADSSNWYERDCPSHHTWVGRERKLNEVFAQLCRGEIAMKADARAGIVITGCGGEGKTMFAEQYAIRYSAAYPAGVVWLSGAAVDHSESTDEWMRRLEYRLQHVAKGKLGIATDLLLAGIYDRRRRINALKRTIEQKLEQSDGSGARRGSFLWVVDDMPALERREDLLLWAPSGSHAHCIVTMREAAAEALFREMKLEALPEQHALAILTRRLPATTPAERQAALVIVALLGRLPLALELAAAAVRTYAGFLTILRQPLHVGLEPLLHELRGALPTDHARSIVQTFDRSLALLHGSEVSAGHSPEEATWSLIRITALLSPVPLPDALALQAHLAMGFSETSFDLSLKRASEAAVVHFHGSPEKPASRMHVLLARTVVDTRMTGQQRARVVEALFVAAGKWVVEEQERGRPADVDQRLFAVAGRLPQLAETLQCADVVHAAGELAYGIGKWADAVELFEASHAIRKARLGPQVGATVDSMEMLAMATLLQGGIADAQAMLEQVVSFRLLDHSSTHPVTLDALSNLAMAYFADRKFDQARERQEWVVQHRQASDAQAPETLGGMSNLALTMAAQGEHTRARELHERVLAARELTLPKNHPDTLDSMHNLALCMQADNELDAAETLQRQVLTHYTELGGLDNADTLSAMHNLALTLYMRGNFDAACDLFKTTVETQRRVLSGSHPATLSATHDWAEALLGRGDIDDAMDLLESVVTLRCRDSESGDAGAFNSRSALARAQFERGNLDVARAMQESLLGDQRKLLPQADPQIRDTMARLALTAKAQGDQDRAAELQQLLNES